MRQHARTVAAVGALEGQVVQLEHPEHAAAGMKSQRIEQEEMERTQSRRTR